MTPKITVRIDDDVKTELDNRQRATSEIVRNALRNYLRDSEQEAAEYYRHELPEKERMALEVCEEIEKLTGLSGKAPVSKIKPKIATKYGVPAEAVRPSFLTPLSDRGWISIEWGNVRVRTGQIEKDTGHDITEDRE